MSQAAAFIERINTDAALRQQAQQADKDLATLVHLAATHGYSFTAEEYLAATKAYTEANSLDRMELRDEDLGKVVGGFSGCIDPNG